MPVSNAPLSPESDRLSPRNLPPTAEIAATPRSAVSWAAIFAGAVAAAVLAMIMLLLGTGLGLSAMSPWASQGASAAAVGIAGIAWLTFTQVVASGMGGYLAGRLRTQWLGTQVDELYFRDTAHGFLSWAVSTLATAVLLSSMVGSIVNGGVQAGASLAGSATSVAAVAGMGASAGSDNGRGGMSDMSPVRYGISALFRTDPNALPEGDRPELTGREMSDVAMIFGHAMREGQLSPNDRQYVALLVARHTGLSTEAAAKRVTDLENELRTQLQQAETKAREAADKARKASAYAALWMFITLLIGAFSASWAATWGGRQRDQV